MVRIVTDSSSDIPHEVALELGITVVPVYVRFGDELYRDGVDIDADQFYHKLERSRMLPKTSTPSPGDFVQCYDKLAREADEILSIHLSSRYSSVCNAAIIGRSYLQRKCTVEVADSRSVSMGCGLIAIAAARAQKKEQI